MPCDVLRDVQFRRHPSGVIEQVAEVVPDVVEPGPVLDIEKDDLVFSTQIDEECIVMKPAGTQVEYGTSRRDDFLDLSRRRKSCRELRTGPLCIALHEAADASIQRLAAWRKGERLLNHSPRVVTEHDAQQSACSYHCQGYGYHLLAAARTPSGAAGAVVPRA